MHRHLRRAVLVATMVAVLAPTGAAAAGADAPQSRGTSVSAERHTVASATAGDAIAELRAALARRAPGTSTARSFAAVPATAPTVTSPTPGQVASAELTLSATSTAPSVVFALYDGTATTLEARVRVDGVDGVASTTVTTFGRPDGPYHVIATDCDTEGCGPPEQVFFTIDNDPPVVTAPGEGAVVGASFTATATAPAGVPNVVFLVDGGVVGADDAAPFSVSVPTGGLTDGGHQLTARICPAADTTDCAEQSDPVLFTVDAQHPEITDVTPSTISPNGDGRFDTTRIDYTLPDPQAATLSVLNAAGTLVFGPVTLQATETTGSFSYVWSGRYNTNAWASHGRHRVVIDTTHVLAERTSTGRAEHLVLVDRVAPGLSSISGTRARFYPVRDGYKDTFTPRVTTNETTSSTKLVIRNSAGRTVRTLSAGARSRGRYGLTWNGRRASGTLLPAGTYSFQWVVTDAVANVRRSSRYPVYLSHKKLYARYGTTTRSARGSLKANVSGVCSGLYADVNAWTNSVGYRSLSECYSTYGTDHVAAGIHGYRLPSAVKYGWVRVSAYGEGQPTSNVGVMIYLDPSYNLTSHDCSLGGTEGWSACPAARVATTGRSVRWVAGTAYGHWYAVKSYKVRWKYYVLL